MGKRKLKPYMAYSRAAGSQEGAILVVAHTVREAKKLAWGCCSNVDEWIDQAATLIDDKRTLVLADQKKLISGEAHIIECPEHCVNCKIWGCGLTNDNLCSNCNQYPGRRLITLYTNGSDDWRRLVNG